MRLNFLSVSVRREVPHSSALTDVDALSGLSEQDIRALAARLIEQASHNAKAFEAAQTAFRHSQAKIHVLTHELRLLRHWKFAPKREV